MRILLPILFWILTDPILSGCGTGKPGTVQKTVQPVTEYKCMIRVLERADSFSQVMDMFVKNGITVVKIEETYLSEAVQEIQVTIKESNDKLINDLYDDLKAVRNTVSAHIERS